MGQKPHEPHEHTFLDTAIDAVVLLVMTLVVLWAVFGLAVMLHDIAARLLT